MSMVFDDTACTLGEGPLWHPGLGQLFWFDIMGMRLYTRTATGRRHWQFGECVSAAGWVNDQSLLIASETALFHFDLATGTRRDLVALEADDPLTRSNDGRADPFGGFWIGTMAKDQSPGRGAIYRWYRGELRQLFAPISVSNAICFTHDRCFAHYADTVTGCVMRVALDADGWPAATPEVFVNLKPQGRHPDGAVVDAEGTLWLAEWGASRVAAYDARGNFLRAVGFDAAQTSCPAFGGPDLTTLYCTSATVGLPAAEIAAHPMSGMTFQAPGTARGMPEYQVIL